MTSPEPQVRLHEPFGFWRLDPLPTAESLAEFYDEQYYGSERGRRAPDITALLAADEAATAERQWRNETIYPDVLHFAGELGVTQGAALDVGSGTGEFLQYLADSGSETWQASGLEPSADAVAVAAARGLDVTRGSLVDLGSDMTGHFDLVTMFNVLEHLLEPLDALTHAHRLLRGGGVVVVQVPNDFTVLQEAVRSYLDVKPWWIAVPDHVNYFDFASLSKTLASTGFTNQRRYATFPMEFFLLAGLDYLGKRADGAESHRRRCNFERTISPEVRRRLYAEFADAGIGRNCIVIAQRD